MAGPRGGGGGLVARVEGGAEAERLTWEDCINPGKKRKQR